MKINGYSHNTLGRLLPLEERWLQEILTWRNEPRVRENMYSQHEISREEHAAWWANVSESNTEAYFVFEHAEKRLGVVSFNGISGRDRSSSWAFYSSAAAPRGTGSMMEFCALDMFFTGSDMRKLNCEVLEKNRPVLNLHRRFGFSVEGYFADHVLIEGQSQDVFRLSLFRQSWEHNRERFEAELMERNRR